MSLYIETTPRLAKSQIEPKPSIQSRARDHVLRDRPEPAVIGRRVRVLLHAPDRFAVLNNDDSECGRGEIGGRNDSAMPAHLAVEAWPCHSCLSALRAELIRPGVLLDVRNWRLESNQRFKIQSGMAAGDANEALRSCGMLSSIRRDVQAVQSIALTIGLIGHPQPQAMAIPNPSRNVAQKLTAGYDRFAPRRLNVREFHAVAIKRCAPITHMKEEECHIVSCQVYCLARGSALQLSALPANDPILVRFRTTALFVFLLPAGLGSPVFQETEPYRA
jgi:hypothetical protein